MTVADLIAELQKLPQDALCITAYDYDVETSHIEPGSWGTHKAFGNPYFMWAEEIIPGGPDDPRTGVIPAVRIV